MKETWVRKAIITKVVDGDTLDLQIELGFFTYKTERIRLVGPCGVYFDAWEKRGPEREAGIAAHQAVYEWMELGDTEVLLKSYKEKGKYGRFLAELHHIDQTLPDLATYLWTRGHGKRLGDERCESLS